MAFRWPWTRLETREAYTSQVLGLQYASATGGGTVADAAASTAIERAIVLYTSAFSVAEVSAPGRMGESLTPAWLASAVRDVLRHGEHVSRITVVNGRVHLVPASVWSVRGGPDPSSWFYDINLPGPSEIRTERVPGAAVVHFMWSRSRTTPWIGCGPLTNCGLSSRILGGLSRRLGDRAVQPAGGFLPVPVHDTDPADGVSPNDELGIDISNAAGRLLIVNSVAGGHGDRAAAPQRDFSPTSFGLDVGSGEASKLLDQVEGRIFSACGLPPGLGGGATSGQAVSSLYRQWIFNSVQGLAARIAGELEEKLEVKPIAFGFNRMGHIPYGERATAIARLIKQGEMSAAQAKATVGL